MNDLNNVATKPLAEFSDRSGHGAQDVITCGDPEIFVRGAPDQSDKKSSGNIFVF